MVRVPSYRLHKATGQAAVTLGGRHYYLGPHGSKDSKRKYNRLVSEYMASGSGQAFGKAPESISMAEVLLAYMRHAKAYYGSGSSSEFHRYRPVVKATRLLYASEPATSFGHVQFKAVRESLLKPVKVKNDPNRKEKIIRSRTYVNKCMSRLLRVFKWAASEGMLPPEIYAALKIIEPLKAGRTKAPETKRIQPVSQETVTQTLGVLGPIVADMVRLQLATGCRPGEVCKIKPSMVDRSKDVWTIKLEEHKTAWKGKERIIYVGPKGQAVLAPYLLRGADEYCFSPKESDKRRRQKRADDRVTPLDQGNRPGYNERIRAKQNIKKRPGLCYTAGTYGRAIRAACLRANIEPWSPNRLRHLAATEIRKDFGLEVAQVILGHASADTTQIYAETNSKAAIETMRRIG